MHMHAQNIVGVGGGGGGGWPTLLNPSNATSAILLCNHMMKLQLTHLMLKDEEN